ncbi:energy-coupling factor transporter transmembrane component T family protein [Streptococcus catagoni]|uniref:energy-coupling factor transporter transmembrane component T family protein n=1 Tax=Streptococcus catagoni TaxID=2654874 RepID=UPI00140967D6|nr:energy-coupling factor transporter transmembrane component T [Streptococcus catagoni]
MTLDVRTKLLLLVLANLTFLFRITDWLEVMIISVFIVVLYLLGKRKSALNYALAFVLLSIIAELPLEFLPDYLFRVLSLLIVAAKLFLPTCLAATILLRTTSVYELVHGLRKWHFPEMLLLTFAVMMRFLPQIKEEAEVIQQSLKLRGIFLRKRDMIRHPKLYLEYLLVPLLMSLLRSSQELTLSTLTKGLAIKKGATECFRSRLAFTDWGIQLWILISMVYMIVTW